jgi:type II secretory pathway component PulF
MAVFEYVTQMRRGGPYKKGIIISESMKEAENKLLDTGVPVLVMKRKEKTGKDVKKVAPKDMVQFAKQMEMTHRMKMPLLRALELARETARSPHCAKVVTSLIESVTEGTQLTEAMKKTGAFHELVIGLIGSGEASGTLEETFGQVRALIERDLLVIGKIRGAMIYPGLVIIIATICVFVMMKYAMPTYVKLYAQMKTDLPDITKMLMAMSNATTDYPVEIMVGIVIIFFACSRVPSLYRAIPATHEAVLKIIVVGPVLKMMMQATFTRTLSNMVKSKTTPLVATLGYCRMVSTNYVYKGVVARAMVAVVKGKSVASAFEGNEDVFSKQLVSQLTFAENSGEMDEILEPMADTLDAELMEMVGNLKVVLEPLMLAVVAVIVGFILIGMLMPSINMPNLLH